MSNLQLKNCSCHELLIEVNKGKKLICFGAGKILKEACRDNAELHFYDSVFAVVDNYKSEFTCEFGSLSVVNLEKFTKTFDTLDKFVILITADAYTEIYPQLLHYKNLEHIDCYIYPFIKHIPTPYDLPTRRPEQPMLIPNTIHYIWFGKKDMPERNKRCLESWSKLCPNYNIVCWNESNYDVCKSEYMMSAYKNKLFAFASDYARLDIIHNHGGIYLDTDVELLKSLDFTRYDKAFIGISVPGGTGNGAGFGSVKEFPIWREVLELYDSIIFRKQNPYEIANNDMTTTTILKKHGFKCKNELQFFSGLRVYPTDVFCPKDVYLNETAFTKNTSGIHHFDASWFDYTSANERQASLDRYIVFWNKYCRHLSLRGIL